MAVAYLVFFGNPILLTAPFVVGLLRYGKPALWLLLVAPFALYQVAFFVIFICVFGLSCGPR